MILAAAIITAAAIMLAGCRRGGRPGTLVIAIEQPPHGFDPRFSTNFAYSARIMQLVYDTLLVKDEHYDLVPSLADSFQQSEDRTTFTFHLRQGVRFHNGKPLTSADVRYTFGSILDSATKSPIRGAVDRIQSIDTPDDLTVVFRAREPFYSFLGNMPAIGIIPEGAGEEIISFPIGTGPYRFVSYREGEAIKLDGNPEYWGGAPGVPHIDIDVIDDNSTRQAAIMSGEVDLAFNAQFDPETVRALKKRPGIDVAIDDGSNISYLGVNVTSQTLANQKVRQALAYAIDRKAIIHGLLRDQASLANSVLPLQQWACDPDLQGYDYDPGTARRLLDEAGFPDPGGGETTKENGAAPAGASGGPDFSASPRLKLTLLTTTNQLSRNIGTIIQDQFRQVGIQLDLRSLEPATFFDDLNKAQFDLYYLIGVGGNQITDIFQYTYYSRYHDDEFSAAISKLRAAKDLGAMTPLFNLIGSILARRDYCPNQEVDRLAAQAAVLDSAADMPKRRDLYLHIAGILTDRGGANRSRYCSPQVDQWIIQAERATTQDAQKPYFYQIQQMLLSDLPQIYLWYPANVLITSGRVHNIQMGTSGSWCFIPKLTLED
jgi:peptide/nickel transport system substrate-binding protein